MKLYAYEWKSTTVTNVSTGRRTLVDDNYQGKPNFGKRYARSLRKKYSHMIPYKTSEMVVCHG